MRVENAGRTIVLPQRLSPYVSDVVSHFDEYWGAHDVTGDVLDFTVPAPFALAGWRFPVWLPGFTESVASARQYLDPAGVGAGAVMIDGGAYAGVVSMMMADVVGETGRVIAFEPDEINAECADANFETYRRDRGYAPKLRREALDECDGSVLFTVDGGMGSSVFIGSRNRQVRVSSVCLSTVADEEQLTRVDYVKLDVEGSEVAVLEDGDFWRTFRPTVSVECHGMTDGTTVRLVTALLVRYGYSYRLRAQGGSDFPLVEAWV